MREWGTAADYKAVLFVVFLLVLLFGTFATGVYFMGDDEKPTKKQP